MATNISAHSTDDFILSRWVEVRDLSNAFHETTLKLRRRFKKAAQQLEAPLQSRGYALYTEIYWAELKAYRADWCVKDNEPLVVIAIGALYPVGYYRVEEQLAYLTLYLEGFEEDQPEQYRRFADLLYEELGGRPPGWQDRTADEDWTAPLWAALPGMDDEGRIALARNPSELKTFALQQFEKFFTIGDAITRAVRRFSTT